MGDQTTKVDGIRVLSDNAFRVQVKAESVKLRVLPQSSSPEADFSWRTTPGVRRRIFLNQPRYLLIPFLAILVHVHDAVFYDFQYSWDF